MVNLDNFIYNFRELKDIKTKDGRILKESLLYRGGPLIVKSSQERKIIDDLNLKVIIDFRSFAESDKDEELYVPKNCEYHKQSAFYGIDNKLKDNLNLTVDSKLNIEEKMMTTIYKEMFFNNLAFKLGIKYVENFITPMYFNCSAGKDRTGIFASIILLLLDAEEEEIYKEYEKTNDWLKKRFDNINKLPLLSKANRNWLKEGINEILNRYKTVDEYFLKEYGIDKSKREKIKNHYLTKENLKNEKVHTSN